MAISTSVADAGAFDNATPDAARDAVHIIEPRSGWVPIGWRELWDYRELLGFLVWRDVKVRYKQTVLGAAWAVLQPLMTMIVFTLLFGRLAKMPSDGLPYAPFAFAALIPWTFFANAVALNTCFTA
jgi:lipopolysaccharide transport system permease protein